MIAVTEAAWVAGFLDGEAYIGVKRSLDRNRYRKDPAMYRGKPCGFERKPTYKLCVQVAQRNRESLDFLSRLFGGTVRHSWKNDQPETVYWQWSVEGDRALQVLEAAFPYFINKRHVAELALEFGRWYAATRVPGHKMADERRQRAEQYFTEIQQINRLYRTVTERQVRPKLLPAIGTESS